MTFWHHFHQRHHEGKRPFNKLHLIWIIPAVSVAATLLFDGLGHLIVWLWGFTISDLFGVKPITFWQAWALLLLCHILFKATFHHNVQNRKDKTCPDTPGDSAHQRTATVSADL